MGDGSSSNAFLRNLSQKKYSWMQSSSTSANNDPTNGSSSAAAPSSNTTNNNNTTSSSSSSSSSPTTATTPLTNPNNNSNNNNNSTSSPKSPAKPINTKESSDNSHKRPSDDLGRSHKKPRQQDRKSSLTSSSAARSKNNINDERDVSSSTTGGNGGSSSTASGGPTTTTVNNATTTTAKASARNYSNGKATPFVSPSPAPDDIPNEKQPKFKYTTFPAKGFTILPTRNVTSGFDKTDATYFPGNKAGSEAIAPNPEEEWRDTIVIHPGSRNLRIGRSSEAFPKTVPHVIARRQKNKNDSLSAAIATKAKTTAEEASDDVAKTAAAVAQQQKKSNGTDSNNDKMDVDDEEENEDDDDDEEESPLSSPEDDIEESESAPPPPVTRRAALDATSTANNREEALREIKNELKWRMKAAKRRAVPNAESQVVGFNTQAYQETIPDHNDPYKVEWTEVTKINKPEYFVGDKALNLPIADNPEYRLLYPWKYGTLNSQDYDSVEEVLGDLQAIWTETIRAELDIEETSFEDYNAVLVIPDLFNRRYTCELLTMLLRYMGFRGALVQQESTCATFGAGVSSACVVDIGSQKTSVACIEDGVCFTDSRMTIAIGGDDITKTFASFLLANRFPYAAINLAKSYDWRLAQELKEKWCTMNEADISVQVYDFFVRVPRQPTKKFQCKVYDEVFLAPLCLVYPAILNAKEKTKHTRVWANANVIDDIADEAYAESSTVPTVWRPQQQLQQQLQQQPTSSTTTETPSTPNNNATPQPQARPTYATGIERSNNYDVYPIDVAIAESIRIASGSSDERLKRFFTNIILVGGGGMISNFNRVLEDRILSTVIARRAAIERVEVLPAPRELDPRLLMWKGGSVLSKLDTAKEMWIGQEEWSNVGARCLRDRALFV
ncbi:hypothetical protein BDB00DRAFT_869624 [Zychaea mexicana]|uniref:uncharacterized protein n=1 Tax=Zychaea mexicana TaxID=64656 RepID=UPI0022FE928D|nr:uncharacterized protein BDB00DRAFT_869624 [Zychaea mexicana]KAI9496327.1 hypothetical protein BDB00DRAFT_869624 [Zychaea mexicana]